MHELTHASFRHWCSGCARPSRRRSTPQAATQKKTLSDHHDRLLFYAGCAAAVENAVRRIESLTRTYVCVLQEKLACKVDSQSIVLPWLVGTRHTCSVGL